MHLSLKTFWKLTLVLAFLSHQSGLSQVGKQASSQKIYDALLRLSNTATVMYLAAHPDDENTRLISWLSNHKHVNTVYLSLTRGDGGQNLIGTEKGPLLGLLRTQELLQARAIDGGKQFFSRANDFGYSKTATETRQIWEEEEILGDVVWAIRKHQPDIIINRFDHESNGRTHGHHTFSAIAGMEAFDLARDEMEFVDQLQYVDAWQPRRIFFNTSWWFYGGREAFEEADKSDMVSVNIGEYYPVLGKSNNEIAAQSRSMHRCQGFGSAAYRGRELEYLEFLKGDAPAKSNGQMTDIFQGIDMTWNRIPGGEKIQDQLDKITDNYDFKDPGASLQPLVDLYQHIKSLQDQPSTARWQALLERKLGECKDLIKWCAGLYWEVTTSSDMIVPGDSLDVRIEHINRGNSAVRLLSVDIPSSGYHSDEEIDLTYNDVIEENRKIGIKDQLGLSLPYWLKSPQEHDGMYVVDDQTKRGMPENSPTLIVKARYEIGQSVFQFNEPIQYKYIDPAFGEIYEPVIIAPPISLSLEDPIYFLSGGKSRKILVEVQSHQADQSGRISLDISDETWSIQPAYHDFSIDDKGDRERYEFTVGPPAGESMTTVTPVATIDDRDYSRQFITVDYDHIPKQALFLPSTSVIEHLNIEVPDMKVGYIEGSGDDVAESLRQIGIDIEGIELSATAEELSPFDAIIVGIRAFNTQEELSYFADRLWHYAESGGTVVVQYNVSRRLIADPSPLSMQLSRDRISEEDAQLTMLDPDHPVFHHPNQITEADFDGWVQERGLYFADEWADEFTPLLSGHDTGEEERRGMLLVAPYGEGQYIYTGLSFFRQLPAGVPGAFKLMVNLLSIQNERP